MQKIILVWCIVLLSFGVAFGQNQPEKNMDGFWTFEKATTYGIHVNNTDNSGPVLDDRYNSFRDAFVEFGRDHVYISCIYIESAYSLAEIEFNDFLL